MLSYETHLLPGNSTPLEQAASALSQRVEDIPTPLRELWDPWTCPESHLPWLAESLSVDFWDDEWLAIKKRSVIAESLSLHAKKGTLYALRRYADIAGAEITKVIRPPQRVYSGPSLTQEEREAWHAGLPQVRVWRRRDIRNRPLLLIAGAKGRSRFFEGKFAMPSSPMERVAKWVVGGVEQDAVVSDFGSYYRIHVPSTRGRAVFSGTPFGGKFFVPSRAGERIFTVQPSSQMPSRAPLGPGLKAVTAEPYLVAEPGTRGFGVFSGDILGRRFWVPTDAHERLYHRWPVLTGRGLAATRTRVACQIMGVGFYSWPRHTLRLHVKLQSRRPRWEAGEGIILPKARFWRVHNPKPLNDLRRALGAAKSAHDTIWLRTSERAGLIVGKPMLIGEKLLVGTPT